MARFDDPNMTPEIRAQWQLALADAELTDGEDAILHVFDGLPGPGVGASAVEPGATGWEVEGRRFHFMPEQQERSFANRGIYEVLTYAEYAERAQLAVLRHELEHVRQYRHSEFLLRASTAIKGGLEDHLGNVPALLGSLYIALPTERAADQAGRRLAVSILGPPRTHERGTGHDVLLFGADDGPPDSEIAPRMVTNLMLLPVWTGESAVRRFELPITEWNRAVLGLAELLCPGEAEAFVAAVEADGSFEAARQLLINAMRAVAPSDPPEHVRASIREAVLAAEAAGMAAAGGARLAG